MLLATESQEPVYIEETHRWLSITRPRNPSNEQLRKDLGLVFEEFLEMIESCDSETIRFFSEKFKESSLSLILSEKAHQNIDAVDLFGLRDGIADVLVTLGNVTYDQNLNPGDDYNKVMRSNWSKYCWSEEEAKKTVQAYQTGTHPDKLGTVINCSYHVSPKEDITVWVVRRDDGKILKSINYKSPKFNL